MRVAIPPATEPGVTSSQLGDLSRAFARAFLILLTLVVVNEGLFAVGLPAFTSSDQFGKYPFGTGALYVLSWVAVIATLLAARARVLHRDVMLTIGAVVALLGPALLSLGIHGDSGQTRALALIVTSVGVIAAAAGSGRSFLAWLAMVGGAVIGWGSVLVGFLTLFGWAGASALEQDSSGRFVAWLGPFSGLIDPSRFGALIGVAPSRQTLGPAMAMLLIVQVVLISRWAPTRGVRLLWLAPAGCGLALLWSMSRTGVLGVVVGLLVAFMPLRRFRGSTGIALVSGITLLLWIVPFVTAFTYSSTARPTDTISWRRALWAKYLDDPAFFSTFGIGADAPPPLGAGHGHNLLVESMANGGQLGLVGLVVFVITCATVMLRALPLERSLALGVWAAFAVAGTMELPVTARHFSMALIWLIVLCAVAAAAGSARENLPGSPEGSGVR